MTSKTVDWGKFTDEQEKLVLEVIDLLLAFVILAGS